MKPFNFFFLAGLLGIAVMGAGVICLGFVMPIPVARYVFLCGGTVGVIVGIVWFLICCRNVLKGGEVFSITSLK